MWFFLPMRPYCLTRQSRLDIGWHQLAPLHLSSFWQHCAPWLGHQYRYFQWRLLACSLAWQPLPQTGINLQSPYRYWGCHALAWWQRGLASRGGRVYRHVLLDAVFLHDHPTSQESPCNHPLLSPRYGYRETVWPCRLSIKFRYSV